MSAQWTKDDLKIYTLIYCANADKETTLEDDFIKSKTGGLNFEALHAEFEKDNDFQSINKIMENIERLDYDHPNELIGEILELFKADENYSEIEHEVFSVLKKLIN